MKKTLLTITTIIWALMIHAQNTMDIHPELLNELWPAKWIADPEMTGEKEGVFLFKKVLTFKTAPNDYVIHISADNRYILYVNGNVVTRGPARGDLNRWLFETVDIASYLIAVENHTAAKVWNMGQLKPVAQMSLTTDLIIQGNTGKEKGINTYKTWRVVVDRAWNFYRIDHLKRYYASGPGEKFNGVLHPRNWKTSDSGIDWEQAKEGKNRMSWKSITRTGIVDKRWLFPRTIPMMEARNQTFSAVTRTEGIDDATALTAGSKQNM